jgi:fructose-bisphosphate aldolase class I
VNKAKRFEIMNRQELAATAKAMVAPGKGLLAMDESNRTCNQRFEDVGIAPTEENRRAYRELILQLWQGLDANANVAQGASLYRAKCNRAAKEGKYSEKMEVAEPIRPITTNLLWLVL